MARRVHEIPRVVPRSTYPWEEWFDGSIWELEQGVDFGAEFYVHTQQFREQIYTAASKRRIRVRTAVRDDKVYVQAFRGVQIIK